MKDLLPLFPEFPAVPAAEWKARIVKDLKGEPFGTLVWKNENGFDIKPFYTAEDLPIEYKATAFQAEFEASVTVPGSDSETGNFFAKKWIDAGAKGLEINLANLDLVRVFDGIRAPLVYTLLEADPKSLQQLDGFRENGNASTFYCAVFPTHLRNGGDLAAWCDQLRNYRDYDSADFVTVDLRDIHNEGALPYYEIAYFMSYADAFLRMITESSAKHKNYEVAVRVGVSTDYFTQIAKLRAMKRLFELLKRKYGLHAESWLDIFGETSRWNLSAADPYTNLIRTSVETMAAVAGGCFVVNVTPFDAAGTNETSDFAQRIALNQVLILKHETYQQMLADPAAGSYYIETYTDDLARKALETYKSFEARGGYFDCLEKGVFDADIAKMSAERKEAIFSGSKTLVGVNRFAAPGESNGRELNETGSPVLAYERSKGKRV